MNNLDKAKEKMQQGWCYANLYNDGKFCSVGALGAAMGLVQGLNLDTLEDLEYFDNIVYEAIENTPEAKVLADTIIEHYPDEDYEKAGTNAAVIWNFNDDHKDFGPIEQMFEKASAKLEEQV